MEVPVKVEILRNVENRIFSTNGRLTFDSGKGILSHSRMQAPV